MYTQQLIIDKVSLSYQGRLLGFPLNSGDSFSVHPCLQPPFPARIYICYAVICLPNLLHIPITSSLPSSPTFTQPDGKKSLVIKILVHP